MIYLNYTGDRNYDIESKLCNHFDGHKSACYDHGYVVGRDYNSISAMVVYVPEENIEEPEDDEYIASLGRGCYRGIREASNKNIPVFFYDVRYDRFIRFYYSDVDIINEDNWKHHACFNYDIYTERDVNVQHIRDLNIGYDKQHQNKFIDYDGRIVRVVRHSEDRLQVVGIKNDNYLLERHAKKSEKIYASKEQMLELIKHGCLESKGPGHEWIKYKNSSRPLLESCYNDEHQFRAIIDGIYTDIYINTGNNLTTMRKTHEVTGTYSPSSDFQRGTVWTMLAGGVRLFPNDQVIIADEGDVYDCYTDMAKAMNLKNYVRNRMPDSSKVYTVIDARKHLRGNDEIIVGITNGTEDYMVSLKGIRKVGGKSERQENEIPAISRAKKGEFFRISGKHPLKGHVGVINSNQKLASNYVEGRVISGVTPKHIMVMKRDDICITDMLEITPRAIPGLAHNGYMRFNDRKISVVDYNALKKRPDKYSVVTEYETITKVRYTDKNTADECVQQTKEENYDKNNINSKEDSNNCNSKSESITSKTQGTTVIRQKSRARVAGVTSGRRRTIIVVGNHRD